MVRVYYFAGVIMLAYVPVVAHMVMVLCLSVEFMQSQSVYLKTAAVLSFTLELLLILYGCFFRLNRNNPLDHFISLMFATACAIFLSINLINLHVQPTDDFALFMSCTWMPGYILVVLTLMAYLRTKHSSQLAAQVVASSNV